MTRPRMVTEPEPTPTVPPEIVELGLDVDYYHDGRHIAAVRPPRPHDAWWQWRAMDCEGRAVEVNTRDEAMRRALAYADEWITRNMPVVVASC